MTNAGDNTPEWAKSLKKCRKEADLSQAEFGDKFGVSAMAVSYWESGTNEPPAKVLFWILEASGAVETKLFSG